MESIYQEEVNSWDGKWLIIQEDIIKELVTEIIEEIAKEYKPMINDQGRPVLGIQLEHISYLNARAMDTKEEMFKADWVAINNKMDRISELTDKYLSHYGSNKHR